jgi:hypothetical protein
MGLEITLEWYELQFAATIGATRRVESMRNSRTDKYGMDGRRHGWQVDIEGVCGEMAVAKALGIYYNGSINTFKLPDVGRLQVRMTPLQKGSLIVRPADPDEAIFVLVTASERGYTYTVEGWMMGRHAKQDQWRESPNGRPPAYFVPINELYDIQELRRLNAAAA